MIESRIEEAVNRQINHEFVAAYNYLAMAAYFEEENLAGFAHWMEQQHQEELQHAMRLYRYLLDRGGRVHLPGIEEPRASYSSAADVFETALKMEQANTAAIYDLYTLATELKDYATQSHLKWFLDEQVEEESSVDEILGLVKMAEGDTGAMLVLNNQLNQRPGEAGSAGE
ncbi:MAG: ferritin [Phycisphaeraceae bacterium]